MMILLRYSLKQAQEPRTTTYNYWLRRYRATLKPKDLPDRAGPGRPLDNFELLKFALVWDASG